MEARRGLLAVCECAAGTSHFLVWLSVNALRLQLLLPLLRIFVVDSDIAQLLPVWQEVRRRVVIQFVHQDAQISQWLLSVPAAPLPPSLPPFGYGLMIPRANAALVIVVPAA